MASRTVCVTGGAGFIGSHVADALVAAGHRVLIVDDLSSGRKENVPAGAELHVLDIRSREAAVLVRDAGVEVLIHHAAQMDVRRSVADPVLDASINVVGTLTLLEAGRRGALRQVIFASTGGAMYGEQDYFPADEEHPARPVSPYGVAKLAVERYLYFFHVEYGFDATCLRYANVYGPRQNPHGEAGVVAIFLDRLLSGRQATINGDGLQTRDYVYVADVVAANLAALGRPGFRIFNVGTGIETDVVQLYRGLAAAVGSDRPPAHGPAKPGEQRRSCITAAKLARELGVQVTVPVAEGLQRTAEWFARMAANG
ncbi:MAG: NAD-dependent epimerase/dehydratase family protein [Thermoanaerobaculaceae bacterium]|nr:NAD-dependent epimerase/dehydratase family protein [Thermoanaerobaculaceae bacterium]MDI9622186.1 NAD-dependent epimerase/dehydratase family protein [Acidobacteriota bacterium]NLH12621.1 NAD-dependent epimerase/dehydratase family protein [Holophagae bacterium]HPW54909.1 NAD-dependent epimerase/dehydratase family protein [Thermoanaerobaculaceae bacterium]